MAYSDYGGYSYRNGVLMRDWCDTIIGHEQSSDPTKHWPMFFGRDRADAPAVHVSLGDQEVRVGLYKQSMLYLYENGRRLDPLMVLDDTSKAAVPEYEEQYDKGEPPYLCISAFRDTRVPALFHIRDYRIECYWEVTDNFYQYCRLTQPDGTIWTGFSGYGVGSGLETAGYGFSTEDHVARLRELFPFKQVTHG